MINIDDVLDFEAGKVLDSEAMSFLLAITILHEYVHYGDYKYDCEIIKKPEQGFLFEEMTFGKSILNFNVAKEAVVFYQKFKQKDE